MLFRLSILSIRFKYISSPVRAQLRRSMADPTALSDADWKKKLTPEQYHVLREKGTERAFTGKYDKMYDKGVYKCAGCGTVLYTSEHKFNSGCGWPAFFDNVEGKVTQHEDKTHGMVRTEITCTKCGGHLGHVFFGEKFNKPTSQRHCVNSLSLTFDPEDGKK